MLAAVVAFVSFPCAYDVLTANPTESNSDSTNGSAINSDLFIEDSVHNMIYKF
jgi:hypothetical protein